MGDPVVLATTGWTFERSCILACLDLGIVPPELSLQHPSSSSVTSLPSSTPVLIPNVTLKSAILHWSEGRGLPRPLPIPPDAARALVGHLICPDSPSSTLGVASRSPPGELASGDRGGKEKDKVLRTSSLRLVLENKKDQYLKVSASSSRSLIKEDDELGLKSSEKYINFKENSPFFSLPSTTSSSTYHTSSSSLSSPSVEIENTKSAILTSSDILSPTISEIDAFEDEVLAKLTEDDIKEQEFIAVFLRHATREDRFCRIKLCSRRLLAALRSMVLSRCAAVQINAVAVVVNLSLEPDNKVSIVRCGVVLPLIDVLRHGRPEAQEHAAAAFFSLALEEENRVIIGSLGAIPPLLVLFACPSSAGLRARRDAGKALYYLSLSDPNRPKIAQSAGAVRALLAVASAGGEEETATAIQASPRRLGPGLQRLAMRVISHLAACSEGRSALMDAEAVPAVVALKRSDAAVAMEEHCVAALFGMSRDRYRFPRLARAAEAEQLLMRVAEGGSDDVRRRMARKTLRAIRREDDEETAPAPTKGPSAEDGNSLANSDWLVSFRSGYTAAGNGSNKSAAAYKQ
ncbi:U-box domain-containing protein 38-like [Zingiber officinale]|nr:U-box domain-containing protein 38-like [Zingiber officinale]